MYYHLYIEHSVPIVAFCKNCLIGSANLDRIFAHAITRECSGANKTSPRASLVSCSYHIPDSITHHITSWFSAVHRQFYYKIVKQTLLRSLGFAIASELYFQPNDEAAHKKAEAVKVCRSSTFLASAKENFAVAIWTHNLVYNCPCRLLFGLTLLYIILCFLHVQWASMELRYLRAPVETLRGLSPFNR